MKPIEFNTGKVPNWCPGCGNFGIWNALKGALADLEIPHHQIAMVSGIGCSGKMNNYVKTFNLHALHGRTLPVATGIKFANHELTVLANGGDGDGYGMGMGHFIHTMRRNINMTYIVHENRVYGLTTGQAAPTIEQGKKTKSTPFGALETQVNPITTALTGGATFIGQGYSGDLEMTRKVIAEAIRHKGFSLVNILQPCVTFGRWYGFEYFDERVYHLADDYDSADFGKAYAVATEENRLPLGVIYKTERPTYEDGLPQLAGEGLAKKKDIKRDISVLLNNHR